MFPEVDHPVGGKMRLTGNALKFTNEDTTPTVPAPVLGQDNEKVYCGFLGLSQEQYSQLQASGIL